jgi:prophage maintenance system killer protein
LNGYELVASEVDATVTFQALAAGEFDESQLVEWVDRNMQVMGEE